MSNEELPASPNTATTKSHFWDWIWPTILGVIIARLFGIAGALVIFGAYYWLKPKFGTLIATAASGALGVVVAVGLSAMIGNSVTSPIKIIPSAENHPSSNVLPAVDSQQQTALNSAAKEIISKYPQLDPNSPMMDQSSIDYVIGRRDAYAAKGHAIDIALRMAANDYSEQLAASQQQETAQKFVQQIGTHKFNLPTPSLPQPATPAYIGRKNEPCQPKDVMTDEEIARCRSR